MGEAAASGALFCTIIGSPSDGAIALLDLRAACDGFLPTVDLA
jgi:hypothetical protein